MIYLERTITIANNNASIDEQIVLYKGDKNIEIKFFLKNSPFKYKNNVTNATYGQLIINRENASSVFSDVSETDNGKILFVITGDMIDEIHECGDYDFQIRLFNEDKTSRVTLTPIMDGISIRKPLCEEGEGDGVNSGAVNYSKTVAGEVLEVFDEDGNYNKTNWVSGDIITDSKLNKVEEALYQINNNSVPDNYATKSYVDAAIVNIELMPGPQGEPGPMGPEGPAGKDADPADLEGYATEDYAHNYVDSAIVILDEILYEGATHSLLDEILGEGK